MRIKITSTDLSLDDVPVRMTIEVTTEHAASSHGQPVVLVNGELSNWPVEYEPDKCSCNILDMLADEQGIHNGWRTRSALRQLKDKLFRELRVENPRGVAYDTVIDEFIKERRQRLQHESEADE